MRCFAVLLNTHKNFIQTYFEINFARPRRCVDVVVVEVVCVVVCCCCCCFRVQYEGITRVTLTRFGRLVIAPVFADRCVPTYLPTYLPSLLPTARNFITHFKDSVNFSKKNRLEFQMSHKNDWPMQILMV